MNLKDFGINLARIRTEKNISAYELSLQLGKAPNFVHRIEYGGNTTIAVLLEICRLLEISPCELFAE